MRHYIAVVHQEGGSAFGVHFPDVPGCFSAADDADALLGEASTALALHLEDMAMPEARSMDEIRNDPDVQSDLADGAFLMAVPYLSLAGRTVRANVTFDAGLLRAIDQTAKRRKLTRSSYLAELARRDIAG